jgi:hypothetical protein
MRPADHDELMLKWVSAALALSLIAAFVWAHRDFRSIESPNGWLTNASEWRSLVGTDSARS